MHDLSMQEAIARALDDLQQGRLAAAEAAGRELVELFPNQPEPYSILATVALRSSNIAAAESLMRKAARLAPTRAAHWDNLSLILFAARRFGDAESCARRALSFEPQRASALQNLGNALHAQGLVVEAIAIYQQLLNNAPDNPQLLNNLGAIQQSMGRYDEAVKCFSRAVFLTPEYGEAHANLSVALRSSGRNVEAITAGKNAIALLPGFAAAWRNLGAACLAAGQFEQAIEAYRQTISLEPGPAETHNYLGASLQSMGRFEEAIEAHCRAIAIDPKFADAYNNLAVAFLNRGRMSEALDALRIAVSIRPGFDGAYNNLGTAFKGIGQIDEAIEAYRQAVHLNPEFVAARQNLLSAAHYAPASTLESLLEIHRDWDRRHAEPFRREWRPHGNDRNPDRRLRLGMISSDFARHPVGYFVLPFLEAVDRDRFEIFAYSDRPLKDDYSERIRGTCARWTESIGLTHSALAERIRDDQIDILFDFAGHWSGNRLLVFARRPAPIQISWIGYVGTTGLSAMDYVIADRFHALSGDERWYAEKIIRLPNSYICYAPPPDAPDVTPLPAAANGYVTFGSLSNPAKINESVIAEWAGILRRADNSHLILKYSGIADPAVRGRLAEQFAEHAIDPERIAYEDWTAHPSALEAYGRIDIALDPFPYSGGLTTCEALWMGTPVVTCPGNTFASRHSFSHLSNACLGSLIANSRDEYADRAVSLATDLSSLAALRRGLRKQVAQSSLCDKFSFARALEQELRRVWREWSGRTTESRDR